MTYLRWVAACMLICVALAGAAADWIAPHSYALNFAIVRWRPHRETSSSALTNSDATGFHAFCTPLVCQQYCLFWRRW